MAGATPPGDWDGLRARMASCTRCHLAQSRTHVVIYRGARHPRLLFVGEAPGRKEDLEGVPFVGRAGQILEAAASEAGLSGGDWGVINVVMCRPPQNKFDLRAARACGPWVPQKIDLLGPRALVTLGRYALQHLRPDLLPIGSSAGTWAVAQGLPLFPMIHPAATLRSRAFAERWRTDWATFARSWSGQVRTAATAPQTDLPGEGS